MLRAVIVDDEPRARNRLRRLIARIDPRIEVAGEASNGYEAIAIG